LSSSGLIQHYGSLTGDPTLRQPRPILKNNADDELVAETRRPAKQHHVNAVLSPAATSRPARFLNSARPGDDNRIN
jgi:hypothetical protein